MFTCVCLQTLGLRLSVLSVGILTDIEDYFNLPDDKTGLLQTAFVVSYMIFAPLFGYLGDRHSRRAIMAAGVFLWSITTLLGSFMKKLSNFTYPLRSVRIFWVGEVGVGAASCLRPMQKNWILRISLSHVYTEKEGTSSLPASPVKAGRGGMPSCLVLEEPHQFPSHLPQ
ncbi:Protein spinster 3 [Homalodisca vitripennis]|nr:Protein spinster 3 [Homalodisca vitripennis]